MSDHSNTTATELFSRRNTPKVSVFFLSQVHTADLSEGCMQQCRWAASWPFLTGPPTRSLPRREDRDRRAYSSYSSFPTHPVVLSFTGRHSVWVWLCGPLSAWLGRSLRKGYTLQIGRSCSCGCKRHLRKPETKLNFHSRKAWPMLTCVS